MSPWRLGLSWASVFAVSAPAVAPVVGPSDLSLLSPVLLHTATANGFQMVTSGAQSQAVSDWLITSVEVSARPRACALTLRSRHASASAARQGWWRPRNSPSTTEIRPGSTHLGD